MQNPHDAAIDANAHRFRYGANWEKKSRREHYEKYAAWAAKVPQVWDQRMLQLLGVSEEYLRACFLADRNLNNIPLASWDSLWPFLDQATGKRFPALGEAVCTAKHIAIYRILKVEPPPEAWKHLPDEGIDNLNRMFKP